ncbi:MAG TPA: cbb3-type cytochrome c oxidase N-terminal domain-containing protein [Cyclobacteriaceae bacterium]|nr:cbb3-type cytochrome c oxidase N-terminal domain-containing protein [Cyclobacteriaceae bacterium]
MKTSKSAFLMVLAGLVAVPAFAQGEDPGFFGSLATMDSSQLTLLFIVAVVLGLIVLLLILLIYLMAFLSAALGKEAGVELGWGQWWTSFKKKHVSGETEGESKGKVLEHHSYDGITELDNFMPPWLQYVFFLSIGFGIVYFINYTVLGWGKTQMEEYQEELYVAQIQAEARKVSEVADIDENTVVYDRTTESLNAGKSIFDNNCMACHASDGGGGVGPNLTDEYWLHGGSINDVFRVIKYGVPEKGMIPWQDQLSPEQMQYVASYVLTLQGTTPANPKEPQGEKYEPAIVEPLDALGEDDIELQEVEEEQ